MDAFKINNIDEMKCSLVSLVDDNSGEIKSYLRVEDSDGNIFWNDAWPLYFKEKELEYKLEKLFRLDRENISPLGDS